MDHGPEPLKEVLSRLFAARGWGRHQARLRLEEAWAAAVGADVARQTQVGRLQRGTLEVLVGNAALMQELAMFRKRPILEQLRRQLPSPVIHDLRFRAGVVPEQPTP